MIGSPEAAVRDYAASVGDKLEEYMERVGLGDSSLKTRAYRRMMDSLDELDALLLEYATADERELDAYFGLLKALIHSPVSFIVEKQPFETAGPELLAEARALLTSLRHRIMDEVLIHMEVPEELAGTAEVWDGAARIADVVDATLPTLCEVPGWDGPAARGYAAMAKVQRDAGREFLPLPRAMADAYEVLGTLNRAVLIAVHDVLCETLLAIRSVSAGVPGRFHHRLRHFVRELERCATGTLPAALDIAGTAVDQINDDVEKVRLQPHLIGTAWPSGIGEAARPSRDPIAARWT